MLSEVVLHIHTALATQLASSDALRYSTRKRTVANYNEDKAELWGLSEEDDSFARNSYTPQTEEEEGDVIESVHDHQRRAEFGMATVTIATRFI